jgi:hypothetical protein
VKMAGGVEDSGLEFPVADLREMSALTASCSCTAGLKGERERREEEIRSTNSFRVYTYRAL